MPTFEERRNRAGQVITLRAKIRRRGFPEVSRSFDVNGPSQAALRQARRLADSWAADIDSEMRRGVFVSRAESEQTTLYECLKRYLVEITPYKKGRVQEASRVRNLQKHPLAKKFMAGIRGADLAVFRDDQLQRVGRRPCSVIWPSSRTSSTWPGASGAWRTCRTRCRSCASPSCPTAAGDA